MNSFPIKIRGKPLPYTTFLSLFILVLVLMQVFMILVLFGTNFFKINLSNYLLGMVLFILLGVIFGALGLVFPYTKKSFDLHKVVLVYLLILVIFIFTVSLVTIKYNPTFQVFNVSINYHWYAFILGSLFALLFYVSEFELEHRKVIKQAENEINQDGKMTTAKE